MENCKDKSVEIEFVGKTFEEALEKAMTHFKAPKNRLNIKVLSEEKKGLFGMDGAKPAKIRVSLIK